MTTTEHEDSAGYDSTPWWQQLQPLHQLNEIDLEALTPEGETSKLEEWNRQHSPSDVSPSSSSHWYSQVSPSDGRSVHPYCLNTQTGHMAPYYNTHATPEQPYHAGHSTSVRDTHEHNISPQPVLTELSPVVSRPHALNSPPLPHVISRSHLYPPSQLSSASDVISPHGMSHPYSVMSSPHSVMSPSSAIMSRLHPGSSHLHSGTRQLHPGPSHLYSSAPHLHHTTHLHPTTPQLHPTTPQLHPTSPTLHHSNSHLHPATSQLHPASPTLHHSNSQLHPATSHLHAGSPTVHQSHSQLNPGSSHLHPATAQLGDSTDSNKSCSVSSSRTDAKQSARSPSPDRDDTFNEEYEDDSDLTDADKSKQDWSGIGKAEISRQRRTSSSSKSWQRRNEYIQRLKKDIQDWECSNTRLRYEVHMLEKQKRELSALLSNYAQAKKSMQNLSNSSHRPSPYSRSYSSTGDCSGMRSLHIPQTVHTHCTLGMQ